MPPQDIRFLVGCLVAAIAIWKLARLITRVKRGTGHWLIFWFCWLVGVTFWILMHHPEWVDTHPRLVTSISLGPIFILVKTLFWNDEFIDEPKEPQAQPAAKSRK